LAPMRFAQTPRRRNGRARPAAAAAELVVLLPVLLLLVLGALDFGRFAYTYIAVTNAARAGAGYGSANPYTTATFATWQANVQQAVADELNGVPGFNAAQLAVTTNVVSEAGGLWRVEVQASYPFQTLIPWVGIPQNLTLQRQVVQRGIR